MSVFYLAHDLDDPAIRRRIKQLASAGETIYVAGFRRRPSTIEPPGGHVAAELGRTKDGRLVQRAISVGKAALSLPRWGRSARGTELILARSLEMLTLGGLLRVTFCRGTPLIYECLDIHRVMLSSGVVGRTMRLFEAALLRRTSVILTSSEAFIREYFEAYHKTLPPFVVWENKVSSQDLDLAQVSTERPASVPWRIGWFGVLRCRRSLNILRGLCEALPGQVEVDIRGRPTDELAPLIEKAVACTPGITFDGEYDRSRDLASLYGRVHFTWAIDFFEEGANSRWLLPNRLYEGPAHLSIPIAQENVETGRWLQVHRCGVVLPEHLETSVTTFFGHLQTHDYQRLLADLRDVGSQAFVQSREDVVAIVASLRSYCKVLNQCHGDVCHGPE